MFPLFGSAASKSHERSTHDCCCLRTISILAHYMVIFCITKIKVRNKLLTCTGTVLVVCGSIRISVWQMSHWVHAFSGEEVKKGKGRCLRYPTFLFSVKWSVDRSPGLGSILWEQVWPTTWGRRCDQLITDNREEPRNGSRDSPRPLADKGDKRACAVCGDLWYCWYDSFAASHSSPLGQLHADSCYSAVLAPFRRLGRMEYKNTVPVMTSFYRSLSFFTICPHHSHQHDAHPVQIRWSQWAPGSFLHCPFRYVQARSPSLRRPRISCRWGQLQSDRRFPWFVGSWRWVISYLATASS